jgi:hypothetical protein
MNILHPLAKDTVKNELDYGSNKDLIRFARELCFKFDLRVFNYGTNAFDLLDKFDRFAGTAYADTTWVESKETHNMVYSFVSPHISKERGRGIDRNTRKSENMKSLIRVLTNDLKKTTEHGASLILHNGWETVKGQVERVIGGAGFGSCLGGYKEWRVLQNLFDGVPLDVTIIDDVKKAYERHKEQDAKMQARKEEISKFQKVHILYGSNSTPIRYGIAVADGSHYRFQDGVKSYFDYNDLPEHVQIHMKMHRLAKEDSLTPADKCTTPLHAHMFRNDSYDKDFETVTYYSSSSFEGTKYLYVFPCTDAN